MPGESRPDAQRSNAARYSAQCAAGSSASAFFTKLISSAYSSAEKPPRISWKRQYIRYVLTTSDLQYSAISWIRPALTSTGVSSRECLEAIRKAGGKPVAAACLIDRSGGAAKVGVKLIALATIKVPAWEADKLPSHLRNTPAVKPGSRGLA